MKSKFTRAFILSHEAWYAKVGDQTLISEKRVMFGEYDLREGGCRAEMKIGWKTLGDREVPYLNVYDNSWELLAEFQDVVSALGKLKDKCITPRQFADLLLSLGFQDITEREGEK